MAAQKAEFVDISDNPSAVDSYLKANSRRKLEEFKVQAPLSIFKDDGASFREDVLCNCIFDRRNEQLKYLLTCVPRPDINLEMEHYYQGALRDTWYALHNAVYNQNSEALKLLIDFNADTNVKNYEELTPFQLAEKRDDRDNESITYLLHERFGYLAYASFELKLSFQLECKLQMDAVFKNEKCGGRFNREEVNAHFDSIWEILYPGVRGAVRSGDRVLVEEALRDKAIVAFNVSNISNYLPNNSSSSVRGDGRKSPQFSFIHLPLFLHLVSEAVEHAQVHLLGYFFERIYPGLVQPADAKNNNCLSYQTALGYSVFDELLKKTGSCPALAVDLIEKLLIIGLDPVQTQPRYKYVDEVWMNLGRGAINFCPAPKTPAIPKLSPLPVSVFEHASLSRVLLLIKLLFHKFVYLDDDSIHMIVEAFLYEDKLFDSESESRLGEEEVLIKRYQRDI